jgi:hypothetical protein
VTSYLDDIASDLSAFHRIDDASELEARVFFTLAMRLPAYSGALAAVAARQAQERGGGARGARGTRSAPRYERSSPAANNARTADAAPPAGAAEFARINAELGATWFSYRKVKPGDAGADQPDLRQAAAAEYPELRGGNV